MGLRRLPAPHEPHERARTAGGFRVSEQVECVVVGAGVVGLAVARALAMQGREVLVLEAAPAIGTGTSSRSSEVVHAGIYYATDSLKAQLCVRGRALLMAFCDRHGVEHRRTGKLIVATSASQLPALEAANLQALANGVRDLQWLDAAQARALEPALVCEAALLSPSTGIVDSHGLMLALQGDVEHHGGFLVTNTALAHVQQAKNALTLRAADGTQVQARILVNAAGLSAPLLAQHFEGLAPEHIPTPRYAKGNYFSLSGRAPFSRLIYPCRKQQGWACTSPWTWVDRPGSGRTCNGWTRRTTWQWMCGVAMLSTPKFANTGRHFRTTAWRLRTPACGQKLHSALRCAATSLFRGPRCMVSRGSSTSLASSRPA